MEKLKEQTAFLPVVEQDRDGAYMSNDGRSIAYVKELTGFFLTREEMEYLIMRVINNTRDRGISDRTDMYNYMDSILPPQTKEVEK